MSNYFGETNSCKLLKLRYKPLMKKFILSTIVMAFAVAVYAGDAKDCKNNTACCATKVSAQQTKAQCTASKDKVACSSKDTNVKTALLSPKAAGEVTKKL